MTLLVLLFLAILGRVPDTLAEDVEVGRVPNISTRNLEGKKFELKQALESGPAVITFWTTWCKPCRKELPELQKLVDKYGERGFQVIAVNGDGPVDQAKVRPFVKALDFEFEVIPDPDGEVRRRFQVEVFPTSLLVDTDGRILHRSVGYRRGDEQILEKEIQKILGGEEGEAAAEPDPEG
jgi:cytochrome c biogenesis protein CcmG/thiol:disulfide interchange protein DsbE